jgi:hypothetical protein
VEASLEPSSATDRNIESRSSPAASSRVLAEVLPTSESRRVESKALETAGAVEFLFPDLCRPEESISPDGDATLAMSISSPPSTSLPLVLSDAVSFLLLSAPRRALLIVVALLAR